MTNTEKKKKPDTVQRPEFNTIPHHESCVEIAKHQSEYHVLWALNVKVEGGDHGGPVLQTIVCWQLPLWSRIRLLFTGKLWHSALRQGPYAPVLLSTRQRDHYVADAYKTHTTEK